MEIRSQKNPDKIFRSVRVVHQVRACNLESIGACCRLSLCRWAASQGLGPVVVCRHVPGSLVLVALDPSGGPFAQLDMRGSARLRGAPAFVAEALEPHMVMDPRGFRRLRPGVEGLL